MNYIHLLLCFLRRVPGYEQPRDIVNRGGFWAMGPIGPVPVDVRVLGGGVPRARELRQAVYVTRDGCVVMEPLAPLWLIARLLPARLREAASLR